MGGWWACFGSVFGSLVCQWVGWFVGSDCQSVGRSVGCLVVRWFGLLDGELVGVFVGKLIGVWVGSLVCWSVDGLTGGWLIAQWVD